MITTQEARLFYQKLKQFNINPPSTKMWDDCLKKIANCILKFDIKDYNEWPAIRQTLAASTPTQQWVLNHLHELKQAFNWAQVWQPIVDKNYTTTGINHSYYLYKMQEFCKIEINEIDFAFEFGAGCGNMCKTLYDLGFNGKYEIFDFPELLTIQKYFLSKYGIEADTENKFVLLKFDIDNLFLDIDSINKKRLFISTHALEESPPNVASKILEQIKDFNYFLIVFSGGYSMFEKFYIDNGIYYDILDFKFLPGHFLSFGVKK